MPLQIVRNDITKIKADAIGYSLYFNDTKAGDIIVTQDYGLADISKVLLSALLKMIDDSLILSQKSSL